MNINAFTDILSSTIRVSTPIILMALGGLLCQRAGVFNIALEGFCLVGAFMGIAFAEWFGGNVWIGVIGAIITATIFSEIYAIFVTKFKANNIIASIAMNMLAAGFTSYGLRAFFNVQGRLAPENLTKLPTIQIPIIQNIPILSAFSGHSIITYITCILIFLVTIMLFRTKAGLSICAVGELESAVTTAGIDPDKVKRRVVLLSGALSGLAGAYLSMVIVSQFSENMVAGRGFTAFTAFSFGNAHPIWSTLASLLFGVAEAIGIRLELSSIKMSPSIIKMFPYVLAIIALTLSSLHNKRKRSKHK